MNLETFLGLTATGWSAISAIVAATAALIASMLAIKQTRAAREAQEEASRPYVVVSVEHNEAWSSVVDLVISNHGLTAARNVRVTLNPPPERVDEKRSPIAQARVLTEPITLIAPRTQLPSLLFDVIPERQKTSLPMVYHAVVTYQGSDPKRVYTDQFTLDLLTTLGVRHVELLTTHDVASALRDIRSSLRESPFMSRDAPHVVVEPRNAWEERLQREEEEIVAGFEEWRKSQSDPE